MRCCLDMDEVPRDVSSHLISVIFEDGPLGVTLRRRADDGVVFVFDIVADSQALGMDIEIGDELWAIGMSEIGDVALDKEAWNGLVQYIKFSPRPLKAIWRRLKKPVDETSIAEDAQEKTDQAFEQEKSVQQNPPRSTESVVSTLPEKVSPPPKPPKPRRMSSSHLLDNDLVELSARLIPKDKEKPSFAKGFTSTARRSTDTTTMNLVKEGRKILKMGELETTAKSAIAIWATQIKRVFILLTDIIIIATPVGQLLQVEHMIDLQVCKLLCEGNANSNEISSSTDPNLSTTSAENGFQLIWPGGTLQISDKNQNEKETWVESIYTAICNCVESDSRGVLGWRHQYMLGTMHAAVIARDEAKVKDLINKCEIGTLNFSLIDSIDEDGYSPLHYACILRLPSIIRVLHDSGADVTLPDSRGFTALHWSALQLDAQALDTLCAHIVDIDELDGRGRTPLYLACVEGKDVSGKTDPRQLAACILSLLVHDADVNFRDEAGFTVLHYLAASWQHEPLKALLDNTAKTNILAVMGKDGMNALHYVTDAMPLKRSVGEGCRILSNISSPSVGSDGILVEGKERDQMRRSSSNYSSRDLGPEDLNLGDGLPTLKLLLKAGCRPNVHDCKGRTALQLLSESSDVWGTRFGEAVDTLLSYGARMDESSSSSQIIESPQVSCEDSIADWNSLLLVDADALFIIKTPMSMFKENVPKSPSSASEKPKDSKENFKMCALCDFKFTLFKRQHHCRLCDAVCCDECSKKKAIVEETQVRCCDSCFNYVTNESEKQKLQITSKNVFKLSSSVATSNQSQSQLQPQPQIHQERSLKELLGNAISFPKDKDKEMKKNSTLSSSSSTGANAAMSTMSEVHERLMERGEKLNRMTDKSAEVSNAAEEFAKLTKQLNDQSKSRWF